MVTFDALYCPKCGVQFAPIQAASSYVCEGCETTLPGGSSFCPGCGHAFDEPVPTTPPWTNPGFRKEIPPVQPSLQETAAPPTFSVHFSLPGRANTGPRVKYKWLGEALQLFGSNAGIWVLTTLFQFIFCVLSAFPITRHTYAYQPVPIGEEHTTNALFILIWGIFVSVPSFIMYWRLDNASYRMANKAARGKKLKFSDIWDSKGVQPIFWLTILMYIATVLGLSAFIIPGILVLALASPAYALVADGSSIGTALRRAIVSMKNDWVNAVFIVVLFWILLLVSAIPLGLGLLITFPMYKLLVALACRDMVDASGNTILSDALANTKASIASTPSSQLAANQTNPVVSTDDPSSKGNYGTRSTVPTKYWSRDMIFGVCCLIAILLALCTQLFPRVNAPMPAIAVPAIAVPTIAVPATSSTEAQDNLVISTFPFQWGPYTITLVKNSDVDSISPQILRISNASGKMLWETEVNSGASAQKMSILGQNTKELEISSEAGDHYGDFTAYYLSRENGLYLLFSYQGNYGDGIRSFTNSNSASRPEIQVDHCILDFDNFCHANQQQISCVYKWNGSQYINATSEFPNNARVVANAAKAKYLLHWQEHPLADYVVDDATEGADSADRVDAIGYWANSIESGDGDTAKAWLFSHANSGLANHLSLIEVDLKKLIPSPEDPLAVDMGDGKNLDHGTLVIQ